MFLVRHELTTARTMAAQSHDIYARITTLDEFVPERDRKFAKDLADQFDRVRSVGDGESQFLHGVIELYQTRVNTKMTVAMERLAVIAAVTLPVTALASVYGMNVIVRDEDQCGRTGPGADPDAHDLHAAAALVPPPGLVVTASADVAASRATGSENRVSEGVWCS